MRLLDQGHNQVRDGKTESRSPNRQCVAAAIPRAGCGRTPPGRTRRYASRSSMLAQRERLTSLLLEGPSSPRLPHAPVELSAGGSADRRRVRGRLPRRPRLEDPASARAGARNARSERRASATKSRSAPGSARPGRALKKKPKTKAVRSSSSHESGLSQSAASLPHLGATRPRHRCCSFNYQLVRSWTRSPGGADAA